MGQTAVEKAEELVDKYWNVDSDVDSAAYTDKNMAIKCALIAVDEIIDSIDWHDFEYPNNEVIFWNEVINELNKKQEQ